MQSREPIVCDFKDKSILIRNVIGTGVAQQWCVVKCLNGSLSSNNVKIGLPM